MRPEDFSPGNSTTRRRRGAAATGFNEAGGFLPRKLQRSAPIPARSNSASMRPEDFSPGNISPHYAALSRNPSFNEAGGFLPRKRAAMRRRRSNSAVLQ